MDAQTESSVGGVNPVTHNNLRHALYGVAVFLTELATRLHTGIYNIGHCKELGAIEVTRSKTPKKSRNALAT